MAGGIPPAGNMACGRRCKTGVSLECSIGSRRHWSSSGSKTSWNTGQTVKARCGIAEQMSMNPKEGRNLMTYQPIKLDLQLFAGDDVAIKRDVNGDAAP